MVKQPFYCGEDQKKYYQETKQKADRDKMNPVYKRFFDIEDSVRANRLETRERAIANGWETKIDENGHVVSDDAVSVSVDDIQADTESQETVDFTPKQEPVQQVESLENEKNVDRQTKHNFHYNLWEMEKGGAKTRYQWNMDAIRTLKQIESETGLPHRRSRKFCRSLSDGADCHRHLTRKTQAGAKSTKNSKRCYRMKSMLQLGQQ